MGLLTMSHRARMMGGVLSVEHDDDGGTFVRCQVPIPSPLPNLSAGTASEAIAAH